MLFIANRVDFYFYPPPPRRSPLNAAATHSVAPPQQNAARAPAGTLRHQSGCWHPTEVLIILSANYLDTKDHSHH